jgi:3-deoxy-D-manno-octulosonate 8-phosphate phosphatase (KDO 8-P phosphatase)
MTRTPLARQKTFGPRARKVGLVLMDVDGVLTDGRLTFSGGSGEARTFNVKDGAGIVLARKLGLRTGFLSGRGGPAIVRRARELGIDEVHLGAGDKGRVYAGILKRLGLSDEQVCYIGDDLMDLPVLLRAGLPVAPADAHPEVLARVPFSTVTAGGCGAVREVIDALARAQGKWEALLGRFTRSER